MLQALKTTDAAAEVGVELRVPISSTADIVRARRDGRQLAGRAGFADTDIAIIAAAISEIAHNIVDYAQRGEMIMGFVQEREKRGLRIIARDEGPGIEDVAQAMEYGYSTRHGLGAGLPGAKWLMDEFHIASKPGKGTTITMKKWLG